MRKLSLPCLLCNIYSCQRVQMGETTVKHLHDRRKKNHFSVRRPKLEFKTHENMFIRPKSNKIKALKDGLTHPDNAVGGTQMDRGALYMLHLAKTGTKLTKNVAENQLIHTYQLMATQSISRL